jgi:hypothetical protein
MLAGASPAAQSQAKNTVEELRKELLQLPYYGVFDFIAFSYNKGTVTLMGYAYHLPGSCPAWSRPAITRFTSSSRTCASP